MDDSDVGNTFEIQVSEIPVLITKGQEYDGAREIRKMPQKSAQMYGYGFKQFIYTWHGEMNSIDQKLFLWNRFYRKWRPGADGGLDPWN